MSSRVKPGRKKGTPSPSSLAIADLLFEAGLLKTVGRTGWDTVRAPRESVAEHSFRTALVGYVLARMSGLSPSDEALVVKACLLHDLHEARLGDLHRMAKLYGRLDERRCERDQRLGLPAGMAEDMAGALEGLPERLRGVVKEADKIECAITAKEYLDAGYRTEKWIEHTQKEAVQSAEGKALLKAVLSRDSSAWFLDDPAWDRAGRRKA